MTQFLAHHAPQLSCVNTNGHTRSIADKIAFDDCVPGPLLEERASDSEQPVTEAGRVYSSAPRRDVAISGQLSAALGTPLAAGLRSEFEWYRCRGAYFHNDAHYDARLFGVWCIAGPSMELVFPRASVRLTTSPGRIAVFDPFEVHGVLLPGVPQFSAADYEAIDVTVLLGFELDLTPEIAAAFGITPGFSGPIISSGTRITAASGALEFPDKL